ncbi:hypothetical protein ACVPOY_12995 [Staphylococcus aureus]
MSLGIEACKQNIKTRFYTFQRINRLINCQIPKESLIKH